jgi:hypothetical protein
MIHYRLAAFAMFSNTDRSFGTHDQTSISQSPEFSSLYLGLLQELPLATPQNKFL